MKAVIGASDSWPIYGLMNTFIFQIVLISKIHDCLSCEKEWRGGLVSGGRLCADKDEGSSLGEHCLAVFQLDGLLDDWLHPQ